MQNPPPQKPCTRCQTPKNFAEFAQRKKSTDGLTAACRDCINNAKWAKYQGDGAQRAKDVARTTRNKIARYRRNPAYKRAFNLWGTTKRRTKIPLWVRITDFVSICQKALDKGPDYELDHIIPLKGKLVSGLHVPANVRVVLRKTNQAKGNTFAV